jgi:acetaldehyde dehydrogenase/alcohol dehydrogenase
MMEAAYYGLTWDEVKNRKADVAVGEANTAPKTAKKAQK